MELSKVHARMSGRKLAANTYDGFKMDSKTIGDAAVKELAKLGIHISPRMVKTQMDALLKDHSLDSFAAMDSAGTAPISVPSVATPLQFLQQWLPGFVKTLTAARALDRLVGITTIGSWQDQEIVQSFLDPSAFATEYGDNINVPFTSWNTNFLRRTIVRGAMGIKVDVLEEARASAMRLNSASEKRQAASIGLEIMRNAVGFYGWNNGNNNTYGLLNDPNLPAYITSTVTGGWNAATFAQIQGDIRLGLRTLRTQSQDQIDPLKVDIVLALPMTQIDAMTTTTDFGISVMQWLNDTYPRVRVESAPELSAANSGANVYYMYAENIPAEVDGSSDGGDVFVQAVPAKFYTVGVERRVQSYVEGFSNATAGVFVKRPYAVVRVTGI